MTFVAAGNSDVKAAQAELAAKRGYAFPEFDWLAEKDPDFERARLTLSRAAYAPDNPSLPVKYRELIAAVLLAHIHHPTVGQHLRRAVREGLTLKEAIEAFEVAAVPGGMPVLHFALPFLMELEKEMSIS